MLKTIPCPDCDGRGFITEFTECSVSGKKCSACDGLGQIEVPITNSDRIRAMSDEELAIFLEGEYGNMATGCALKWLKQPAEEERV